MPPKGIFFGSGHSDWEKLSSNILSLDEVHISDNQEIQYYEIPVFFLFTQETTR